MSRLQEITERLQAITRELEGGEPGEEQAGELTREAADLAAEVVEEVNRRLREAAAERDPGSG